MMLNFDLEGTGTRLNATETFLTAVNKERGTSGLLNYTESSSSGAHRSAVRSPPSHPPLVPCSPSPCWPIVPWDWSISRLLQTGLGAPVAPVILCGFGCVTAAWLVYGALITPPPGGLRGAWRGTGRERKKSV